MEKEEIKKAKSMPTKDETMEAVQVIQLLMNEYGKKYLNEGEFTITIMQKGGMWSLFLWPNDVDLSIVEHNVKLALMQVNQLKVTRENEKEELKAEKLRKQYVA